MSTPSDLITFYKHALLLLSHIVIMNEIMKCMATIITKTIQTLLNNKIAWLKSSFSNTHNT